MWTIGTCKPPYFYLPGMWDISNVRLSRPIITRLAVPNVWLEDLFATEVVDLGGTAPPHNSVAQYSKKA